MDGATVRRQITDLEQEVESELGTEVDVYGVRKGYKVLRAFLREDQQFDDVVEKQAHQYWTFLTLLRLDFADAATGADNGILFAPSRGSGSQLSAAPSVFVEPALPVYPERELWEQHRADLLYLKEPDVEAKKKHHSEPDFLLTEQGIDKLPWVARAGQPIANERQLKRWCATGDYQKIANALGLEEAPATLRQCYQVIEEVGEREDTTALYEDWLSFSEHARYLIECKHNPLTERDFSQILWYGIAYEIPLVIVTAAPITEDRFHNDLDSLPVEVTVIEDFDIERPPSECLDKLRFLQAADK